MEFSPKIFKDVMKEFKPVMSIHLYPQRISIENSSMDFSYSGPIEVGT